MWAHHPKPDLLPSPCMWLSLPLTPLPSGNRHIIVSVPEFLFAFLVSHLLLQFYMPRMSEIISFLGSQRVKGNEQEAEWWETVSENVEEQGGLAAAAAAAATAIKTQAVPLLHVVLSYFTFCFKGFLWNELLFSLFPSFGQDCSAGF